MRARYATRVLGTTIACEGVPLGPAPLRSSAALARDRQLGVLFLEHPRGLCTGQCPGGAARAPGMPEAVARRYTADAREDDAALGSTHSCC